jgi:putative RNA 2'-phosphotransferase
MNTEQATTSKFLSLVLRHKPELIDLKLDTNGWAEISDLIRLAYANGKPLNRELIERIVATSDKQRLAISNDGSNDGLRIRANQGHSVDIDLGLAPQAPPSLLYHGTADRFVLSIREGGLRSGERRHVHLSSDVSTATIVGNRHGRPAVTTVRAGEMADAGHAFYFSANGVWLTHHVPAKFIDFPAH